MAEKEDGIGKVAGYIAGAVDKVKRQVQVKGRSAWPKRGEAYDSVQPGKWDADGFTDETGHLPWCCPVRALGYAGEHFYFLDTMGQVFNTGEASMGVERLQKLFAGHEAFLDWAWPAFNKDGKITGFKAEMVRRALYAACRERGAWSSSDIVRGRGAWRDLQGNLILHCGDVMWIGGKEVDTGEHGDWIYPRRPPALKPWAKPVEEAENPALHVMQLLSTWNFARGSIDALFLFGWMGVAMLGGALEWRPSIFAVGDAGTGKSELFGKFGLMRAVLGRMMVSTTNATDAGLYQLVGHDSLPISIDELEGDDNEAQAKNIIKMARDAASGSIRIRGGNNHKGVDFVAQSTFSFSGINPPPIPPANLTRLVIIEMMPLDPLLATSPPVLKEAETVGPRLLRLLMDRWPEVQTRLQEYYDVLRSAGHGSRGQKTFGTFLAVAHTMLGDAGLEALGLPNGSRKGGLELWAQWLKPDDMPELEGVEPEWRKCLDAILTSVIDNFSGGSRKTVAQEIQRYHEDQESCDLKVLRERLALIDLGVMGQPYDLTLVIPNQSAILGKALIDTPYGDRGGNGSWKWALRRAPDEIVQKEILLGNGQRGNRYTVAGVQRRCLFVSLKSFRDWRQTK